MKKAVLIVLDSVGAGELPDAAKYGDAGANTLGHIIAKERPALPNLSALGLARVPGVGLENAPARGGYGRMAERSPGKDTTTGHWEIAGLTLARPFPTYPHGFPEDVLGAFERAIGTKTLGNKPASGTAIIEELGAEHLRTGYPIVYTSADSVFQIAAHEDVIPVDSLYDMCETARGILQGEHAVGRVIARPFAGAPGHFARTPRRRDFSLPPTGATLLDALKESGLSVLGVGKIEDIFCHRGLTGSDHAAGNEACVDSLLAILDAGFHGLCFVNLVDFDMQFGHRRDVAGYARALEDFDRRLPEITGRLNAGDLLIITADHGCDPTHAGTDHTREYVPLLASIRGSEKTADLGTRETFADIAATVCEYFDLPERFGASSFLTDIR